MSQHRAILLFWCAALMIMIGSAPAALSQTGSHTSDVGAFKKLPFEELFDIEITTVSRRRERLVEAASAVQVITAEDIRRAGVSSLPEALRLASNLQVAQFDSRQWAISARGFTTVGSNKLLVMIDGRTVYTNFAGVFWDVQNVMLEDVERIEVISGPGGTLWGANAVNGVINVITKSPRDTQGALVSGGGGSLLNGFGNGRYGNKVGKDLYFRLYGMGFDRDNMVLRNGSDAKNDWHIGQGGFRADWLPTSGDVVTFQGDFYAGAFGRAVPGDLTVDGQNLIARWTHPLAADSDLSLQVYWDRTWRRTPNLFAGHVNTYDIEFQHRLRLGERNKFIWGGGYRLVADRARNGPTLAFSPARRDLHLFNGFAQDEIDLIQNRLTLTVGSKFEHNDYTDFELQPNVRMAWTPVANHTLWTAISRAVRSPSRVDTELFAPGSPPFFLLAGGDKFDSETVIAYEAGYRTELAQRLGVSISAFYNDYDDIRSVERVALGQFMIRNGLRATSYGVELAAAWQALDWWRLRGGYTYLRKKIRLGDSGDINRGSSEGNDPQHQFLIQSMINLPANFEFDSVLRYVDNLNQLGPVVPSYVSLDLRLGWRPTANWEFAIVGQNLLDKTHGEFGARATRQEIPRSVYGKITWKFWTGGNEAKSK